MMKNKVFGYKGTKSRVENEKNSFFSFPETEYLRRAAAKVVQTERNAKFFLFKLCKFGRFAQNLKKSDS